MIGIVDYGVGNVQAFVNIYNRLGMPVMRCRSRDDLNSVKHIVLPGVGTFDWAMSKLNESGLRDQLDRRVLGDAIPVIGICVGMQMMADSSEEGRQPGLGWIKGRVLRFNEAQANGTLRLPHMGWNDVVPKKCERIFYGRDDWRFYFLHSYYFAPDNQENIAAESSYAGQFTSAIRQGEIFGAQFHPEKSHAWGVQLLANFAAKN